MAAKFFLHAWRMVFGNFSEVVRLTLVLGFTAQFLLLWFLTKSVLVDFQTRSLEFQRAPIAVLVGDLAAILVNFVLMAWLAIGWHRFILLQEYPSGNFPTWDTRRVIVYALRALQLFGILLGIAVVSFIFLGVLGHLLSPVVTYAGLVFLYAAMGWLSFRLCLALPGMSIDLPMTFAESWDKTASLNIELLLLAVLTGIASFLLSQSVAFLPVDGLLQLVLRSIVGWLTVVIGVSLFTTLYGVVIESRSLS